ncbi:MAG: DNA polymerase III subunit beta [bacterium]|nr:DNA polymerase III subunit beta [bacterium]
MRFTCIRSYLYDAVAAVERVVEKSTALPILQNVLLKTEKGRVLIAGTNLEIGVRAYCQAKIDEEGEITLPAKTLMQFLTHLQGEKVVVKTTAATGATIEAENASLELKTLDAKDFPIIPELSEALQVTAPTKDLHTALGSLVFFAASGEVRPELGGVFCAFDGEMVRVAATDSFRLGEYIFSLPKKTNTFSCIIPTRTVNEFLRIFSNGENVDISANTNQILFKQADRELISRLIEGKYPDYTAVIPTTFATRAYINRELFIQALRAASACSGKNKEVKITLVPQKNKLHIESRNSDVGEYVGEIPCEGKGGDLAVTCNYQYFLDALGKLESEMVSLEGNKETDPLLLKNINAIKLRYVIMPLRSY